MLYYFNIPVGKKEDLFHHWLPLSLWKTVTIQPIKGYYTANSWFPPMDTLFTTVLLNAPPTTPHKIICLLLLFSGPAHRSPLDFISKIAILLFHINTFCLRNIWLFEVIICIQKIYRHHESPKAVYPKWFILLFHFCYHCFNISKHILYFNSYFLVFGSLLHDYTILTFCQRIFPEATPTIFQITLHDTKTQKKKCEDLGRLSLWVAQGGTTFSCSKTLTHKLPAAKR